MSGTRGISLSDSLRAGELEPLLTEHKSEEQKAAKIENDAVIQTAIPSLPNDLALFEIFKHLDDQSLARMAQTSKDTLRLARQTQVKNSFKIFGNVSDSYIIAKSIEGVESLERKAPLFVAGAMLIALICPPIAAVIFSPALITAIEETLDNKKAARSYLAESYPIVSEAVYSIARAKYLDRSIFQKLSEFDRMHPQLFTLDTLLFVVSCSLLQPNLLDNFIAIWKPIIHQTFAQFDAEINTYKDTKTAFKTLTKV